MSSPDEPLDDAIFRPPRIRTLSRFTKRRLLMGCIALSIIAILVLLSRPPVRRRNTSRKLGHPDFNIQLPLRIPEGEQNWETRNRESLQALADCLPSNTCKENQTSIVLLASVHFPNILQGKVSGEDIWAASVRNALAGLGYTFFYFRNLESAAVQYRMFPNLVKVVLADGRDINGCITNPACIKSESNPVGVPIWKIFTFHFWDGEQHPLGRPWTLSPEDYRTGNQYIGYSLEEACNQLDFVAHEQRRDQVYILAKRRSYFHRKSYPWTSDALVRIRNETRIALIAGFINDRAADSNPMGVTNLGKLNKTEFLDEISHSRALLGILKPWLSPSPYDALCLGVPFINPIVRWNRTNPMDRSAWYTQHNGLKWIEEPYVYHVFKGDTDGLVRAVQSTADNPINRFIPPAMTERALADRVSYLVEHDWRTDAEVILTGMYESDDDSELRQTASDPERQTEEGVFLFL
ncbi:hypothetical protein DACRYDRAFT_23617 [Dacryopinax primogenitus]|uniref:Glycosyltransferase family 18 catalytic domain-containing protein n=1 Tax=Dacryopinax primogenitus (strain DJM 731) TaxID=1858805 RepID=M5FR10_DACPD|nr:uncharacterized protein DACRYDRAFT_23617 [Dacryopinax primogenitus]EJT99470.1 hypothetical protein DACRYDRAFT_23617 [Dacryopinax primogenitus]